MDYVFEQPCPPRRLCWRCSAIVRANRCAANNGAGADPAIGHGTTRAGDTGAGGGATTGN
jgi:hypothetical protein